MHVADLMTRKVVTVGLGTSVRHAADLMLNHRVSGLPVVDDAGLLVGLVTEGDLLRRAELGVPGCRASLAGRRLTRRALPVTSSSGTVGAFPM